MPTEIKPLFHPEADDVPKLKGFVLPTLSESASRKLATGRSCSARRQAEAMKETELLGDFIADVFVHLLGYTGPARGADPYTLKREATVEVDGKFADAAFGLFDGATNTVRRRPGRQGAADPLDRPFAGRKLSAVDQALRYAVNLRMRLVSGHQPARNPPLPQGTRPVHLRALRDGGPGRRTTRPSAGSSFCSAPSGWCPRPAAVTSTSCWPNPGASAWN